jgi:hypothetical protein
MYFTHEFIPILEQSILLPAQVQDMFYFYAE